jgi:hypothetical protein
MRLGSLKILREKNMVQNENPLAIIFREINMEMNSKGSSSDVQTPEERYLISTYLAYLCLFSARDGKRNSTGYICLAYLYSSCTTCIVHNTKCGGASLF